MPSVEGPLRTLLVTLVYVDYCKGGAFIYHHFYWGSLVCFNVSRRMMMTLNRRDWAVAVGGGHARDCQHYKKVACISASL